MRQIYILGLLLFVSVASGMPEPSKTDSSVRSTGDQELCDTCIQIIQDVEDSFEDPQTQDVIVEFVQTNICALMPTDTARTCSQEARVLIAQAVASFEQSFPPARVCTMTGMCDASLYALSESLGINKDWMNMVAQGNRVAFPGECVLCKLVADKLEQRLRDPDARKAIYDSAMSVCQTMMDEEKIMKCCGDVDDLFSSVDSLIDDIDPQKACEIMQFCGEKPEGDNILAHHIRSFSYVLSNLESRIKHYLKPIIEDPTPQNCDGCKHVIEEVDTYLTNPDNQQMILSYAKSGCEAFESYKDQCEEYIDEYGPMLFAVLISYLQPEPFCSQMGYCPPSTSRSVYAVV